MVVVEHVHEPAESELARQRGGFVTHSLHQVPVATEHENMVIDQSGPEVGTKETLGDRHAHPVDESLTERPGRDLDAGNGP